MIRMFFFIVVTKCVPPPTSAPDVLSDWIRAMCAGTSPPPVCCPADGDCCCCCEWCMAERGSWSRSAVLRGMIENGVLLFYKSDEG